MKILSLTAFAVLSLFVLSGCNVGDIGAQQMKDNRQSKIDKEIGK